jgi:plastocyanin
VPVCISDMTIPKRLDSLMQFPTMGRVAATILLSASAASLWACASYSSPSGSNSGSPTAPTGGAITINVVAINGAMSFSPNPATIPAGQTVVWHNVDSVTHRVVLNDGSVDTGNLDPGTFSSAMTIGAVGGYHCSIHPVMVGTLTR